MLKTDVLYLKKLNDQDLDIYQQIYTDSDLMRFVVPVLEQKSVLKSFNLTLKKMAMSSPKMLTFVIRLSESGEKIGVTGLRWNQTDNDVVEIGMMIKKTFQRKGFAHEAKALLIKQAFTHWAVNCIIAICERDNVAANQANIKLGFKKVSEFTDKKDNKKKIKWIMKNEENQI